MSTSEETERVLQALAKPKYKWRTLRGVAREVNLDINRVEEIVAENNDKIIKSTVPNEAGEALYTTRDHFFRKNFSAGVQSNNNVTEIATEISETDPGDIQKIASTQIQILNEYHQEALSQAKRAFIWAVVVSMIGFTFFIGSLVILFVYGLEGVATAGVIGAAIVEVVAGLQFYLYGRSVEQLAYFHQGVDRTQRFLLANSISQSLENDYRQKSQSELVKLIALSTQPTGMISTGKSDQSNNKLDVKNH